MLKKRKKERDKRIITTTILLTVFIILLSYSLNIVRNTNIIEYSVKYFSDIVLDASTIVTSSKDNIVKKDNIIELKSEIKELKKQLNLNSTYTNYDLENATVVVRNKGYWLDNLIIDKGKKNNIKKNMAVITDNGLLGIISKVYRNSSEVRLITTNNNKNKITIYIETASGDFVGYIDKYDKDKKELIIKDIDKDSDIKKGDKVMTSGMNKVFPKGIYVGKVKDIQNDQNNLSKIIYVEIKQNLNKIHYVAVVKKVND